MFIVWSIFCKHFRFLSGDTRPVVSRLTMARHQSKDSKDNDIKFCLLDCIEVVLSEMNLYMATRIDTSSPEWDNLTQDTKNERKISMFDFCF